MAGLISQVSSTRPSSAPRLTRNGVAFPFPQRPRATLQSAVARLRRTIGGGFIETQPSGYRFSAESSSLDLPKFRQAAGAAQERRAEDALARLSEAIGLWRGTPLDNVSSPVLLNGAVPRLTELYLSACEQWAALCLQTGRYDVAVSRLTPLVDEHPFRERMAGQLMLGLYRCGRQADGIAVYESLRHGLSEEMGIDPSQELQELHLKILRADPTIRGGLHQTSLTTAAPHAARDPTLVNLPGFQQPQRLHSFDATPVAD